jgi:hypothetical protein
VATSTYNFDYSWVRFCPRKQRQYYAQGTVVQITGNQFVVHHRIAGQLQNLIAHPLFLYPPSMVVALIASMTAMRFDSTRVRKEIRSEFNAIRRMHADTKVYLNMPRCV